MSIRTVPGSVLEDDTYSRISTFFADAATADAAAVVPTIYLCILCVCLDTGFRDTQHSVTFLDVVEWSCLLQVRILSRGVCTCVDKGFHNKIQPHVCG